MARLFLICALVSLIGRAVTIEDCRLLAEQLISDKGPFTIVRAGTSGYGTGTSPDELIPLVLERTPYLDSYVLSQIIGYAWENAVEQHTTTHEAAWEIVEDKGAVYFRIYNDYHTDLAPTLRDRVVEAGDPAVQVPWEELGYQGNARAAVRNLTSLLPALYEGSVHTALRPSTRWAQANRSGPNADRIIVFELKIPKVPEAELTEYRKVAKRRESEEAHAASLRKAGDVMKQSLESLPTGGTPNAQQADHLQKILGDANKISTDGVESEKTLEKDAALALIPTLSASVLARPEFREIAKTWFAHPESTVRQAAVRMLTQAPHAGFLTLVVKCIHEGYAKEDFPTVYAATDLLQHLDPKRPSHRRELLKLLRYDRIAFNVEKLIAPSDLDANDIGAIKKEAATRLAKGSHDSSTTVLLLLLDRSPAKTTEIEEVFLTALAAPVDSQTISKSDRLARPEYSSRIAKIGLQAIHHGENNPLYASLDLLKRIHTSEPQAEPFLLAALKRMDAMATAAEIVKNWGLLEKYRPEVLAALQTARLKRDTRTIKALEKILGLTP